MLRKVLILIMLLLPITCMATAGFAERYNEHYYFAEKMAPFVGIVFVLLADTMIFYFNKQNIFWKFLLSYSLIFILVGGNWAFQLLCFIIGGFDLLIVLGVGIINWIIHFFSNKWGKLYRPIFIYSLSFISFLFFLIVYDSGCDYLKQTFPIINEKFQWVDPEYNI